MYAFNCGMGLMAQLRGRRYGIWHHVAYALVVASALAALVWAYHPALWLTVAALALFPKARPRTWPHPTLAVVGAIGYAIAWASA